MTDSCGYQCPFASMQLLCQLDAGEEAQGFRTSADNVSLEMRQTVAGLAANFGKDWPPRQALAYDLHPY